VYEVTYGIDQLGDFGYGYGLVDLGLVDLFLDALDHLDFFSAGVLSLGLFLLLSHCLVGFVVLLV